MNKTQHRSNNDVLGAPKGVSIEQCEALPITRVHFPDGSEAVVSYWTPTEVELERLKAGKAVALVIWGRTHAPLWVGVDGDDEFLPKG